MNRLLAGHKSWRVHRAVCGAVNAGLEAGGPRPPKPTKSGAYEMGTTSSRRCLAHGSMSSRQLPRSPA